MNGFCPHCRRETQQTYRQRSDEILIRGVAMPLMREYFYCKSCGEEFENPTPEMDPVERAYQAYREQRGMLQPDNLIRYRKSIGLTQKEFSTLLGIGNATLIRYENGALQSDAHDRMIRLCMLPRNLLICLQENQQAFSEEHFDRLNEKLALMDQAGLDLLTAVQKSFAAYPADLLSGQKPFDAEKLFQAIQYFCFKDRLSSAKLARMLFYADFSHYKDHGVSITGLRYQRAAHGPLPEKFATWLTVLSEWRKDLQAEEEIHGDLVDVVYFTLAYDWTGFKPAELAALATVKDKFQAMSAKQVREAGLKEAAVQLTPMGEWISYTHARDVRV
jgi:putative zinc finger/helix-turn-helix YgiT family protein